MPMVDLILLLWRLAADAVYLFMHQLALKVFFYQLTYEPEFYIRASYVCYTYISYMIKSQMNSLVFHSALLDGFEECNAVVW